MIKSIAIVTAIATPLVYYSFVRSKPIAEEDVTEIDFTDHPLLTEYSSRRSYTTSRTSYPVIRTFYKPHAHTKKLKDIADLPLLVFIHGMGGQLPQWASLLGSLVNIAPCFGIELPGHGLSPLSPKENSAYEFNALVELWKVAIETICEENGHDRVVLIGHSLGCAISVALASTTSKSQVSKEVVGFVALCPKILLANPSELRIFQLLLSLPNAVFDIFRWLDKRGGEESTSVRRFVGEGADRDLKRLQLKFNSQFTTPAWKIVAAGLMPIFKDDDQVRGFPRPELWQGLRVPILLIAGEADNVTKPAEAEHIVELLRNTASSRAKAGSESNPPGSLTSYPDARDGPDSLADETKHGLQPTLETPISSSTARPFKIVMLPAPAGHALPYAHSTYRTVAGLIEDFFSKHVSEKLSLGWQLTRLTTSGKWDVKNLEKWKRVLPVSAALPANGNPKNIGMFRALKTMREQDDLHTPRVFVNDWADQIYAVIDISHDAAIYNTKTLEEGHIQYHKFPTVSKVPPTVTEVCDFITLVNRLRGEAESEFASNPQKSKNQHPRAISVHCHYGYNRTGFFIVCYLVERLGFRVQDAIDEFAVAKPPGIRHDHFIDTLFVRYCVGLRRASTGSLFS